MKTELSVERGHLIPLISSKCDGESGGRYFAWILGHAAPSIDQVSVVSGLRT
jgi:hypothetical protein